MAKYLYECVDAQARRTYDFVNARSIAEARQLLVDIVGTRQLREATVLDDDLMAHLREHHPEGGRLDPRALARVEAMARSGSGSWSLFVENLHANRWFLIACGIAVVAGLLAGARWVAYAGVGGVVLHLAAFLVGYWRRGEYARLLRAGALGDWSEVLRLARRMQATVGNSQTLAFDLDVRRGVALAATGHLHEAVSLVGRWRSRSVEPAGMYWSRLANIYHMGHEYGQFVVCMRRCFKVSGDATWARIDLALAIARLGGEPREALELLRHDSVTNQPESTARFVNWARGAALLRMGDYVGAELALTAAVQSFAAQVANPAVWGALALSAAALAVAVATNGNRDKARALVAPLMPIISVLADAPLVTLVNREVLGLNADSCAP